LVKHLLLITVLYFQVQYTIGQRTETALNFDDRTSHFTMEAENDFFFDTDQYYTAGEAFSYTHSRLKKTPAQLLMRSKDVNDFSFSGFGLEHRMFTPYSIVFPDSISNDRPYSSYIMITNFSVLIKPMQHLKMSTEIGIGILGPAASGEQIQYVIHQLIGSSRPIGWGNQLNNSFIIDYQFRIEKGFFTPWIANHFIPIGEVRVGTLQNKLAIGLMIKFGNSIKYLSGINVVANKKNILVWDWVFEAKIQEVFFDATLQGGLMNGDEKDKTLNTRNVLSTQYHLRTGINIYYSGIFVRFMMNYNSNDFNAGDSHKYGSINFGFAF
jgi:lipid A 3-O-deacylase